MRNTAIVFIAICLTLFFAAPALAQPVGDQPVDQTVGVEERLGETIPLNDFRFTDEEGKSVVLAELFDRPVILTLVYYSCPGICTPLLNELSSNVQKCRLIAGQDFRMITISFDPDEGPELARQKRINMIDAMETNAPPPDGWRFLVGDEENIQKIADAMGFHFIRDKNGVDFVHPASVMFLSRNGKIARYLNTLRFNPADLELAVIDAKEGRARSVMQKIQRLCYAYEPEGTSYVLKLNRIVLFVTLLFVAGFVLFLRFNRPAPQPDQPAPPPAEDAPGGETP